MPEATVTVLLADLETMMAFLAAGKWNRVDDPGIATAWKRLTEAKEAAMGLAEPAATAEPPLPPGEYGTVHVMGHEQREGWVTDGSIAGAACLDVKDEAGRLIAKIPPHSVYMFEPGLPPHTLASLRRPGPLAALPAGDSDPRPGEDDGGPHACDCGPGERCFECATDDEAAAAIPPRVDDGSPF